MRFENTDGKMKQPVALLFWSRALVVFSLLFIQNIQAQFVVAEGANFYSEKGLVAYQSDSTIKSNQPNARIYISSGVKISGLDSERNYEIVETISSEKKKIESTKHLALKTAEPTLETALEDKKISVKENPVVAKIEFSTQESEVYFSFSGGFSKITIPVSQLNVKQVFNTESYKISLAFQESKLVSVCFKVNGILTAQNKSAFSVRPPPFLA